MRKSRIFLQSATEVLARRVILLADLMFDLEQETSQAQGC